MKNVLPIAATMLACVASPATATAQKAETGKPPTKEEIEKRRQDLIDRIEKLGWKREGAGRLGSKADVGVPKGWRFTGPSGTQTLLKMYDNVPSRSELGMLTTEGLGPWVIFEFDDVGFVKDDEKDSLNASELLKTLREGQDAANEERRKMGIPELELVGWAVPPRYNEQTHNLEWATRVRRKGGTGESINYNTRLLGRKGVMEVGLVCEPDELDKLLPEYQAIMSGFKYLKNESYAEYRQGDKVAQYGLAALVAGGAAVAASKMGIFAKLGVLLAKLGKGAIAIVVAIAAAGKKLVARLFGKRPEA
ncbi:MAG: DUF2167 domain-containing protein [Verrucomicrobiaceae bacterium]|nr:DUF2167 domain-containing protein [Verrucomicrobiaceae bacterium]